MQIVVRDRGYGRGKHHIPANEAFTEALCGAKPSSVGPFSHRGERTAFEELCPDRICKRCRAAEVA
jgi:hypothetical protein